jgi:hypothetical protein
MLLLSYILESDLLKGEAGKTVSVSCVNVPGKTFFFTCNMLSTTSRLKTFAHSFEDAGKYTAVTKRTMQIIFCFIKQGLMVMIVC